MAPKCEIFDRSDFYDFSTIKSLWVGDFGVKILNLYIWWFESVSHRSGCKALMKKVPYLGPRNATTDGAIQLAAVKTP
jgi:hypothetical protein